ncbi:putative sulfate exporter family transporter [Myxococcota bacterium]|nr:putative sulfate exporter family transporter [Myxococcota bacterium]
MSLRAELSEPKKVALWIFAAACFLPWITPPIALFAGLAFALVVGNTDAKRAAKVQKYLLQTSVVGLGFGIHITAVVKAGSTGLGATAASLVLTMAVGLALGKVLKVEDTTSRLVSTGTSICGGSAIAAMGPVLSAAPREMSIALGSVFILNALALFVFPELGHLAGLSEHQFGYWAAIAIHDTSSVVGAAARYGQAALDIAVPVKLARALWILPMVAVAAVAVRSKGKGAAFPWFVLLFLLASVIATLVPAGAPLWKLLVAIAKGGLAATLFLIGAGLSRETLRSVGWRPMAQAVVLWVLVSATSLWVIKTFVGA